jgi:hypothetical protein
MDRICGFNQLLDLRDLVTGVHSTRLAEWAVRVARKLGLPETGLYQIEVAALLHDIGKIDIPDAILKKEGKLTDSERELMNKTSGTSLVDPAPASRFGESQPLCSPSSREFQWIKIPGRNEGRGDSDRIAHRFRHRRVRRHDLQSLLPPWTLP